MFGFIPKKEFWIDRERKPGEEGYFIDSMLAINRLMSHGISYDKALEKADRIEKRERVKSKLMKKEIVLKKQSEKFLGSIHRKLLKKYSHTVKVWIVNGEAVRGMYFVDFTEGGHDKVYPFVPKNEVWIDDDVEPKEIRFIVLHELHERALMSKGMKYYKAHMDSSKIELYCRKHPKELNNKIKVEIRKNK